MKRLASPPQPLRTVLTCVSLGLLASACAADSDPTAAAPTHESGDDLLWDEADVIDIALDGAAITVEAEAAAYVEVDGAVATIGTEGTYRLSGTLDDGRIVVDAGGEDLVQLILAGVDITCTTSAPIFVQNAGKVVVILAEGTDNVLTDSDAYVFAADEDEPNAPLFSKDDMTIHGDGDGTGTLTVYAHFEDGIVGKDGLVVSNARVIVSSQGDDGIRGKDYLVIRDSVIEVEAADDALRSTNDEDPALGYVRLDGGHYALIAGGEGIQAVTGAFVDGGDVAIEAGGGADAPATGAGSANGIEAGVQVVVSGGTLFVDVAGDALHSDNDVQFDGGELVALSADEALHAEADLRIGGGSVEVVQSEVGLEASLIELTGGEVRVVASGDGINLVAGEDAAGASIPAERLSIDGAYVYIAADGDGVDVDADIIMNSGTLIVDGPDTALEYDGRFDMHGGVLVAAGSADMVHTPSADSAQATLHISYASSEEGGRMEAGTIVRVESDAGDSLLTFEPRAAWQSVVFSAPELGTGTRGTVWTGGSAVGVALDGVYADPSYSGGTERTAFSISEAMNFVRFE